MYFPERNLLFALVISACTHVTVIALPFGVFGPKKYLPPLQVSLPNSVPSTNLGAQSETLDGAVTDAQSRLRGIVELKPTPERPESKKKEKPGLPVMASGMQKARLLNPEWLDEAWSLPPQARGDTVLSLSINSGGRIESIVAEPGGSEFSDWLLEELPKRARFAPAYKDGAPVASTIRIRLNLEPLLH